MAQGRKIIGRFTLLRSVEGRFYLLAFIQPGKSVMGAALHGIWGTPGHSSKGGENEKVDSTDHGKEEDKVRVAEGAASEGSWHQKLQQAGLRICAHMEAGETLCRPPGSRARAEDLCTGTSAGLLKAPGWPPVLRPFLGKMYQV